MLNIRVPIIPEGIIPEGAAAVSYKTDWLQRFGF